MMLNVIQHTTVTHSINPTPPINTITDPWWGTFVILLSLFSRLYKTYNIYQILKFRKRPIVSNSIIFIYNVVDQHSILASFEIMLK